jgi:hypothetical protein
VESSQVLAAPGVRTVAQRGWRRRIWSAIGIVEAHPRLWLYGVLGFALRGGVLLLTLPIIALPTQVEVRGILGNNLGSTGFSDAFWGLVAVAAIATTVVVSVIVLMLAALELAAFERLAGRLAPATDRRRVLLRLFAVQLLTVSALAACAIPLAFAIGQVAYTEIVRPTSGASIYGRVLGGVTQPLLLFGVAVVVIEILSALTTRELLVRSAHGGAPGSSARLWLLPVLAAAISRMFRSPIRTVGTAAIGWAVTAATLLPAAWAIGIAWMPVRGAFLQSLSFADVGDDIGMLLVAIGLAGVFVLGMLVTGLGSAVRSALLSLERLG